MLNRLLWRNQNKTQLVGAVVGALLGLFLLLGALQFYFDARDLLVGQEDLLRPDFVVVNKKVSMTNTIGSIFGGGPPAFEESEIEELTALPFVEEVTPFIANQFKSTAQISPDMANVPALYTEMFFEAIDDAFVDADKSQWVWEEGDTIVPIIIPGDYLKLYNFGFAPSQGLPQISEKTVALAKMDMVFRGNGDRGFFYGRIVGFSDRINSVLIPLNFMQYANRRFAPKTEARPSRLILVTPDPSHPELAQFLKANDYETNQEKLKGSKLNAFLQGAVWVVGIIGIAIIALALMVFLLSFQLIITRSSQHIQWLIQLGHSHKKISRIFIKYLLIMLISITLLAWLGLYLSKIEVTKWFVGRGLDILPGLSMWVYVVGLGLVLLFAVMNILNVTRHVRALA